MNRDSYSNVEIGAALDRAADLLQEQLDQDGDQLAWDAINFVVNAAHVLLDDRDAGMLDVFMSEYGAEDEDDARAMAQSYCFLD